MSEVVQRRGTVEAFEGLVLRTAGMYCEILRMDEDDVRQRLRIKVWKALDSYRPARATQSVEKYVFSCVRNEVKDLLKQADRAKRNKPECFMEDQYGSEAMRERFDAKHLSHDEEAEREAYVERTVELPSTLNFMERQVVALLLLDLNQTEIAARLGWTRTRVRKTHASVMEKMADWDPGAGALDNAASEAHAAAAA
jgi:RNA polymerase sigma factor (sigma-70 family)